MVQLIAPFHMPGTLFVVATPIGNLEDITVRALRILREVTVIAAEDTRRTAHLLARHAIATPTTSLHEHNEAGKSASLVARLQRGDDVALVSDAGTPTVSDPGGVLIRRAIEAGIRVEPIPGASAVLTALAASGLPTDSFSFLGFPPTRSKDRKQWFARVKDVGGTVIFFEAPHRIRQTLVELRTEVGECPVVIARELTKIHEQLVRGPISAALLSLADCRGEFTVVALIGQTTDLTRPAVPSGAELAAEIGAMTANEGMTKRKALNIVARKHGLAPNELYKTLETAKKSGKRPI
jgi:16S rRNA (cytidine1402-2'-O)-methyltransferase